MFRRSVLICALVFCAPLLWTAVFHENVPLTTVGLRFLIAIPVAAVLVALVRFAATPNDSENEGEVQEGSVPGPVPK